MFLLDNDNSDKKTNFSRVKVISPIDIVKLSSHGEHFNCPKCVIKFNVDGH